MKKSLLVAIALLSLMLVCIVGVNAATTEYNAITDFSSTTQGYRGWYYNYDFDYPMVYGTDWWGYQSWHQPGYDCAIFAHGAHPAGYGGGASATRRWVSPESGQIHIFGNAYKGDTGGGDGVIVEIYQNTVLLWSRFIAYDDSIGYNFDLTVPVQQGDLIDFNVEQNINNYYDTTYFAPTIVLTTGETPVAAFDATPVEGTEPLTVQFNDLSTGDISSWKWSFGDRATSSDRNPSHEYTKKGLYTVTLEVNGPLGGDSETKKKYINVTPDQSEVAISMYKFLKAPLYAYHAVIVWTDKDGKKWDLEGNPGAACGICDTSVRAGTVLAPHDENRQGYTKPRSLLKGEEARNKDNCILEQAALINSKCICYNGLVGPNSNSVIYTELTNCGVPLLHDNWFNRLWGAGWGINLNP